MFFSLSPLRISKAVKIEDDQPRRTIEFGTRLNTYSEKREPNAISDGTRIDQLPCGAAVYCLGEGDHAPEKGHEYLMFYSSEFSSDSFYSPAHFLLQVYLPPMVFEDLWRMVRDERRMTFHGQISRKDLTELSHDPIRGGTTYEWNADDKMKVVTSFSFRVSQDGASDLPPSKLAEEYEEKYGWHSQMTRVCLDIIRQTEREAERKGAEMRHTRPEDWPDVIGDLDFFYSPRQNPKHLLWLHIEAMEDFAEDRFVEDGAIELMASLLKSPWLRCDELEVALVDYMIFWEVFRFSEQIRGVGSTWFPREARKTRAQLAELAAKMRWAYSTLRPSGGVFSPFQIRAALLHAQDAGAAWKPPVFAMLDRAATRDPPVWIVPK